MSATGQRDVADPNVPAPSETDIDSDCKHPLIDDCVLFKGSYYAGVRKYSTFFRTSNSTTTLCEIPSRIMARNYWPYQQQCSSFHADASQSRIPRHCRKSSVPHHHD